MVDLFKTKESIVKESICNDNVCLLPSHLKIFNNDYISKPKIYNLNNENDISKINSFKAQSFRMGKPYDIFNKVNLNIKDDSNRNDDKVAENTKIKYTKGTIKVASIS